MTEGEEQRSASPDPRRWKALAICLVGGFMVLLDVSIVNVALPSIRTGLHASASDLQWVVSGYALTFGLLLIPSGRFGDVRGRRAVFVGALGLFTLASIACGAALSSTWLIIARLLQGLAGGTLTPQITAIIQEMFSGRERSRAFGTFGAVVGISTAVGPLLGGLLIALFGDGQGWRFVFLVNLPVGVIAMPIAWRLLPRPDRSQRTKHDYDPVGVVLIGVAAVMLLLPFVQERSWQSPYKWLLVPGALAVGVIFVLWDRRYARRGREPVVDLDLFKIASYSFGTSVNLLYFAGFTPLFFVFSLYLQIGIEYSALATGLALMPFAIGSGVAAALGGRIVLRFGRPLVALGLVIVAVGFAATSFAVRRVPSGGTGWATVGPLLVAGIGSGLVITPNQTLTLSQVPVPRAGTAGGVMQTAQRIGAAVGIAAVGAVFFAEEASSGNYAAAVETGTLVATVFVLAALLLAVVDIVVHRIYEGCDREQADPSQGQAR